MLVNHAKKEKNPVVHPATLDLSSGKMDCGEVKNCTVIREI